MEGYTNIIGSTYDFDDLDIESRVVDEWNQDEEKKPPRPAAPKWDEQAVLNERVRLENGQQANVFSVTKKKDNSPLYICYICTDTLVGVANLRQHAQGSKHRANMSKPFHPRAKFIKLDPKENLSLEPGEPVPPGLEEEIFKSCAIQPKLDDYKSPLIGLEFLVELTQSNSFEDEYYYCLLCEKTGSERNMFIHLTSVYHQLKYLSMYFPTVAKKLHLLPNKKMKKAFANVIRDIIGDIEAKYGRMKPFMEPRMDFDAPGRMAELSKTVHAGPHFREKDGECFDEKATPQYLDKCALDNLNAPPLFPPKPEKTEDTEGKKEAGSMFNKINRINVDKKQLRPREDDARNSSPDVQIVDIQLPPKSSPKMPMSGRKRRTRSRSLSSVSNVSSSSRNRLRYSRHHSRTRRRTRSRSRSRSRSPSRYRRRSPYYHRHSPSYRSRDRSPYRKRRYHSPHDRSRERERLDRYGRSREIYEARNDKYRREKETLRERNSPVMPTAEEKLRWESFREELKTIETLKLDKLKYYEKNPEQHPQYPNEWKTFWNQRYNELQKSGIDPSKHDFKPEWISFWTKRMKELYEEDLSESKKELKKKFDLPDEVQSEGPWKYKSRRRNNSSPGFDDVSPPTPDKKDVMADIKSTWKALTGSDIKDAPKRPLSPWEDDRSRSRSPTMRREQRSQSPTNHDKLLEDMPQRKTRTSSLIFVLRKLTVLEQQLGYLAPKVFELMHQALVLEKVKEEASLDLLHDPDNAFYLETVREKLIALLCAGVVPRNIVNTARSAIKHIDISLHLVSKLKRVLPDTSLGTRSGILPDTSVGMHSGISAPPTMQYAEQAKPDPVIVPGVGQVDKVAIAQQIANALIEQGKTDVTEAELGQLINAVVGMAEASANSSQPMTTANFLQQLQHSQNANAQIIPPVNVPTAEEASPVFQPISQEKSNETSDSQTAAPNQQSAFGALKLLQSAYNEPSKTEQDSPKPDILDNDGSKPDSPVSDDKLATTLAAFNNTPKEEQSNFIQKLKTSNPEMYKRLCPFIPVSSLISPDHSKRSPIIISLSKAKSEPKVKAVNSGRLSPFSSRSGGANPAVDEGVIDIDEDVKVIGETLPQSLNESKENPTFISNKIDLDDEDEDDDYSYEDVYKAAQEKLKQNQLFKEQKISKLTQDSVDLTKNDKLITTNPNKSHESGVDSQQNISLPIQTNLQQQRPNQNEKNQNTQFLSQPIQDYDSFREIPSRVTQPAPYQPMNVPIQNYQEPMQRKPEAYQGYSNSEEYQNDSEYSFTNVDGYNNREQPSTDSYYSRSEFQSEHTYSSSYDGSYRNQSNTGYMNKQVTPEYGNNINSYGNSMNPYGGDPYRQQQPAYNAPNRAPWRPNFPAPPQRFPNSNYPPY